MRKEDIEIFIGKYCCVVLKNKLINNGKILKCSDENLTIDDRFNGLTLIDLGSIASIGQSSEVKYGKGR